MVVVRCVRLSSQATCLRAGGLWPKGQVKDLHQNPLFLSEPLAHTAQLARRAGGHPFCYPSLS